MCNFFEKITIEIYLLEKLLAVFCVLLSDTKYAGINSNTDGAVANVLGKITTLWFNTIEQFRTYTFICALDAQLSPNQAWIDRISRQ